MYLKKCWLKKGVAMQACRSIMLVLIMMMLIPSIALAETNYLDDVKIVLESENNVFTQQIEVKASIHFYNQSIFNDHLKMSYHIFDKEDNLILWENQRVPILIDPSGTGDIKMSIDLSQVKETEGIDFIRLELDVVDEENAFWYSTNKDIEFGSNNIVYTTNSLHRMSWKLSDVITSNSPVFILNSLVFIAVIIFLFKFRRSELFIK